MAAAFLVLLVGHGAIHGIGFAKAFGFAEFSALSRPISPGFGLVWLLAAVLFLATALAVYAWPRVWWIVGGLALAASTVAILPSWHDAKAGAVVNLVVLAGVSYGALVHGPTSLERAFLEDSQALAPRVSSRDRSLVSEGDLAGVPAPVRRYLRRSGVIGQPRVHDMVVQMHGRIRGAPEAAWMPFHAEQRSTFGSNPSRLFYMTATRAGLPIHGYHRFVEAPASMKVRAAGLVPILDMSGREMTQSETVTLLNDVFVMAPGALLDLPLHWEALLGGDGSMQGIDHVRVYFTHLGRTVSADLVISADGTLLDFVSDDRFAASADGTAMTQRRWSTPLRDGRAYGHVWLPAVGEGRWHDGDQSWAYLELTIDDVRYNVAR